MSDSPGRYATRFVVHADFAVRNETNRSSLAADHEAGTRGFGKFAPHIWEASHVPHVSSTRRASGRRERGDQ